MLFQFASVYLYEWDAPKAEKQLQSLALARELVTDLLGDARARELLKPEAIEEMVARAQHRAEGFRARSAEELALMLNELGDLTMEEIIARCAGDARAWRAQLVAENRVQEISIATRRGEEKRWIISEGEQESKGAEDNLRRFLAHAGPVTREKILDRYAFDETRLEKILDDLVASREIVTGVFFQSASDQTLQPPQYCHRNLLEQIHRHTLTLLRKEIQPVSIFAYADFLTRWQKVQTRVKDAEGTRRALEKLRGVTLPLDVWMREVLPARVSDFDATDLNALCQSGELIWVAEKSRARFFFRGEGALFLNPSGEVELSADAQCVYDFLKSEGASFSADLENGLKMKRDAIQNALIELAQAGRVTNDSLDALGAISGTTARVAAPESDLEMELSARRPTPRGLTQTRYREAKRRVAKKLRAEIPRGAWSGRWSLVQRASVMGAALSEDERAEKIARVLLERYGVVTREGLEREEIA
ncbi:MAG: hypothetical protein HY258_07475, partial [Chloroflexi bacterium]|nr:hypothetical protein [Chloroflexota bacterium]